MPFVYVASNVAKESLDVDAALRVLSKATSEALGKPEQYVMARLDLDVPMIFQATNAPCAMIQLRSIGKISAELNPATAKALTDAVASALHVSADRVFMNLDDIAHYNWGMGGSVF